MLYRGITTSLSHLHRVAIALVGEGQEGVAPLLQPEAVSQHGAQI